VTENAEQIARRAYAAFAEGGGCDPQVRGHVAANLKVGNDRGMLVAVITQLLPFIRETCGLPAGPRTGRRSATP
jgi:hypothetical protein